MVVCVVLPCAVVCLFLFLFFDLYLNSCLFVLSLFIHIDTVLFFVYTCICLFAVHNLLLVLLCLVLYIGFIVIAV